MEKSEFESIELRPGTVLSSYEGDYTIVRTLGQGGFGITYLAQRKIPVGNITITANFAIKEHFIGSLCNREASTTNVNFSEPVADTVIKSRQAFVREAGRIHELGIDHPNIIKINEVFEANNTAYYVMEYLEGETLDDYVLRHGRLSAKEATAILLPIAEAVAEAHRNRLTHYDIKPQNIILARQEDGTTRPVLIDFGLAKHYDKEGKATSTMAAAGYTHGYAPIEQYAGLRDFTPQADVYALAATLYFCLTGETPVEAVAFDTDDARRALEQARVPETMIAGIVHAMQTRYQQRPENAGEFVTETFFGKPAKERKSRDTEVIDPKKPGRKTEVKVTDDKPGRKTEVEKMEISTIDEDERKFHAKSQYIGICVAIALLIIVGLIRLLSLEASPETEETPRFIDTVKVALPEIKIFEDNSPETKDNLSNVQEESNTQKRYDTTGLDFREGVAIIMQNNKWGFVDESGKIVVPLIYDYAFDMAEGLSHVEKGGKFGYINNKGKEVVPLIYDDAALQFSEGLAVVGKKGKYGFIDKSGNVVIPLIYDYCRDFNEGLAAVDKDKKRGFIDKTGKIIIPLIYDADKNADTYFITTTDFTNGIAKVIKNGKAGFIDKQGNEIIPIIYEKAFRQGAIFSVMVNGQWRKIDKYGNFID